MRTKLGGRGTSFLGASQVTSTNTHIFSGADHTAREAVGVVRKDNFRSAIVILDVRRDNYAIREITLVAMEPIKALMSKEVAQED